MVGHPQVRREGGRRWHASKPPFEALVWRRGAVNHPTKAAPQRVLRSAVFPVRAPSHWAVPGPKQHAMR